MTTSFVHKGNLLVKEEKFFSSGSYIAYPASLSSLGTLFLQDNTKKVIDILIKDATMQCQTIHVTCEDAAKLDSWRKAFLSVGVKMKSKSSIFASVSEEEFAEAKSDPMLHRLELMLPENWSVEMVIEWLGYLRDSTGESVKPYVEQGFQQNDITGKALLDLGETDLKGIGVSSLGKRKVILREIDKLKQDKKFCFNEYRVWQKFDKVDPRMLVGIHNMQELIAALSTENALKATYLSTDIVKEELLKYINEDMEVDQGAKLPLGADAPALPASKKIFVKLVVTELLHSDRQKSLRKVLSPIICSIPTLSPKFGIFHTALIIGPWYLEWTDISLCIPKKIAASMALLALDVDSFTLSGDKLTEIADKLAKLIVEWNCNRMYCLYKLQGKNLENEGNCQDFVDTVLSTLGLQLNFSGAMTNFLSEMRTKGTSELVFKPSEQFIQKFELKETSYSFESHEALDDFIRPICNKLNEFPEERMLLKSFDRGFWCRHFHDNWNKMYAPSKLSCPLGDPCISGSLAGGM